MAHSVCEFLAGPDNPTLQDNARLIQQATSWSQQQSMDFVSHAAAAYCPRRGQ
ncbi:DUF732 domain-containing protein [Mycobacterium shimoidei]|uniref:DUF732 domain-containing protein n=1 Tax=Mycobacterium shimoidei TaxID=29313 RepID=UPI003CC836BE